MQVTNHADIAEGVAQEEAFIHPAFLSEIFWSKLSPFWDFIIQASFSWDWGPAFPSSGIWLPIRSSLHFQLTTFIVHPIRLSLTDIPRIKYLKWDYKELTETQLQVSQYAWFLPHTKEGPGMSNTYTCHSNKDRSMSLSVYVRSESLNHKGSDTLGESDGLSQPSTNTRNDGHKLVPWWRYCLLLNLVWVERWGGRRDMECNTHYWQSVRLPIVKVQVAKVTNFSSWALVA